MSSSYRDAPIELTGGDKRSRSKQWSSQKCINLFIDVQESGRTSSAVVAWPGEVLRYSGSGSAVNRALFFHDDEPYQVVTGAVYKLNENGTRTLLTNLPGSGRVSVASDGNNIVFRLQGSVDYINRRFVMCGSGTTYVWNNGSLTTLSIPPSVTEYSVFASNITNASVGEITIVGGDIIQIDTVINASKQIYVFQQKIFVGGSRSFHLFYMADSDSNPIRPLPQAASNRVGVASDFSMASSNNYLYLLGNDNAIYRTQSGQLEPISNSSITDLLRSVDTSTAYGTVVSIESQFFYILQCRSATNTGVTLVYSEKTNRFTTLQTGVTQAPHLIQSYIYAYNKHLVSDYRNQNIYEWTFDEYESNGNVLLRQLQTPTISGRELGVMSEGMIFGYLDLTCEFGVGNADVVNPVVRIEYSLDGGLSFREGEPIYLGRQGQGFWRGRSNDCFFFYDMVIRMSVTDPAFVSFHAASIGVQKGGY